MEYIELNLTQYHFVSDFKNNQSIRTSFNKLTSLTFGFSLEDWYLEGFWGDYYVPYSLLHNDEVVSNVSINRLEFDIEGQRKIGLQIGTVMTDERYRRKGLSKFIMERVLHEWKEQADFIYLFANNTVLDFYPKFGFEVVAEYQYSQSVDFSGVSKSFKKLNVEDAIDRTLLMETVKKSTPIAKVSMRDNVSMIMFYAMSFKKNCIYHIEKLNTIVVAEYEGGKVYLNDVFSMGTVNLSEVIDVMSNKRVKKVVLGFAPLRDTGFDRTLVNGEDTLFMLSDQSCYPKDKPWMFPVLSHA